MHALNINISDNSFKRIENVKQRDFRISDEYGRDIMRLRVANSYSVSQYHNAFIFRVSQC